MQKRPAPLDPTAPAFRVEPPSRRRRQTGLYESVLEARKRSNALASVRPARLDELLATQCELRRLNICIRGLPEACTTPADPEPVELEELVESMLQELTGRTIVIRSAYRVGRVSPSRPCPVITEFAYLDRKLTVLCANRVLYAADCPDSLKNIRIYHDLSPGQMDWKFRLRAAYNHLQARDIRVIWRNGYRLFAYLDGAWTEYYPVACLID